MNHVGSCSLWGSICLNFTPLLMSSVSPWALVLLAAFAVWVRLTPGGAYEKH